MVDALRIPNRFESLQEIFGQNVRPLIVAIDQDLHAFTEMRERARVQNGGILAFLLGTTGVGKTTAVHSAAINMPEAFAPVVTVPGTVPLRDALPWVTSNVPPPVNGKTTIVLFDGREVSDDDVGVRQFLSGLNQYLRRRADIVFCWPTTDDDWHKKLRRLAETIGGSNFAPSEADYQVQGPPAAEWPTVLERMLLQFGKTYDDVGVAKDLIGELCAESQTVGEFLTKIGAIVAQRVARTRETKKLPQLLFVVTSSGEVVGEANRIRRAGTQILAPEPLLGHSPKSEVGKWWSERNHNPDHHLGYMISLFQASLVTMTASAVVYGCTQAGAPDLQRAATDSGARPDRGNAKRTVKVSEFYRFIAGEPIPEFTSAKKGIIQDSTRKAYAAIQTLSTKRHKAINRALCDLTREHLPGLQYDDKDFEVNYGGDVQTDAVVRHGDRIIHVEFHHLSESQCRAATMSSYIMEKIRTYALYHQLIPR